MFHSDFCVLKITVIWYFEIFWKDWYSCRMIWNVFIKVMITWWLYVCFANFSSEKNSAFKKLAKITITKYHRVFFLVTIVTKRDNLCRPISSHCLSMQPFTQHSSNFLCNVQAFSVLLFSLSLCSLFTSFVYIYCRICCSLILFK